MKKIWMLLSVIMLTMIMTPIAYGQQHVVMEVIPGYEGVVVSGGLVPVEVILKSNEDVNGKLRVSYEDQDEEVVVASEMDVRLIKGNETRYVLPLMIEREIYTYQKDKFLLVDLLDASGSVMSSKYVGINEIIRDSDLVTGVLSSKYADLTYLKLVDVVSDNGNAMDMSLAKIQAWQLDDGRYLNAMDLLIVDGYDESISDKQMQAIINWVEDGGLLIVGSGDAYIAQENILNKLGLSVTSQLFTNQEGDLAHVNQVQLEGDAYLKSPLSEGVYSQSLGNGKVLALTYALSDMSLFKNTDASNYVEKLVQEELADMFKMDVDPNDYRRLNNILNRVPRESMPSIKSIIIIVMLYLFCAGPIAYSVLKSRGQRNYYWHTVAGLSILTTIVVFIAGNGIDFNKCLANSVTMVDQRGGASIVTTLLGVKDSGVGDLDIAPEAGHITWSGFYEYQPGLSERVYYYDELDHVVFKDVKKFQFVNLMVEHKMNLAEKDQKIIFDETGASLEISNPFEYPLVDVAIILNQEVYWIERIEAGATARLAVDDTTKATSNWDTYDFYDYDYNYSNGLTNEDINDRYYKNKVVSAFFDASNNNRLSHDMSPIVFGWIDEPLTQHVNINGHKTALSGTSFWVDEVAIGRPESGDVKLPMGVLVPQAVLTGEVYYDNYDRSYYGYGSVQFTLDLPEWIESKHLHAKFDNREGLVYKIYNPQNQTWDSLEVGGGQILIEPDYISGDGQLRMSVENNGGHMFYGPQLGVKGVVQND